jgi:hypothetical protein
VMESVALMRRRPRIQCAIRITPYSLGGFGNESRGGEVGASVPPGPLIQASRFLKAQLTQKTS